MKFHPALFLCAPVKERELHWEICWFALYYCRLEAVV